MIRLMIALVGVTLGTGCMSLTKTYDSGQVWASEANRPGWTLEETFVVDKPDWVLSGRGHGHSKNEALIHAQEEAIKKALKALKKRGAVRIGKSMDLGSKASSIVRMSQNDNGKFAQIEVASKYLVGYKTGFSTIAEKAKIRHKAFVEVIIPKEPRTTLTEML